MRSIRHSGACRRLARWLTMLLFASGSAFALAPGEFTFEWKNGLCDLDAQDAKVVEILEHIQQETGIPIDYDQEATGTTTQLVKDGDLERVMRLLGENVVLTYVADATAHDGYRVNSVKLDPSADAATRAQVARNTAARPPLPPGTQRGPGQPARETTYSGVGGQVIYARDRKSIRFRPISATAPIARSGISPEEDVIEIDGKPISSFRSVTEVSQAIRGEAGSSVTFTVRKKNGSVVRHQVRREKVTYKR